MGEKNPEFWPECKCPFFTLPTGRLSCYGDEVATTLRCLAQRDGEVDVKAITSAIGKMTRPTDINFIFVFLPCKCVRLLIMTRYKFFGEYFFDKKEFILSIFTCF